MISPFVSAADPALHLDAAVARAERRRATLERLIEIGMELVEEIRERTVQASLHPEPRHDPCRGFAAVSRAVRLTVALEAKVEEQIVAWRNGEVPFAPAWPMRPTDAAVTPAALGAALGRRGPAGSRPGDREHEADRRERETERLVESESDDVRFSADFNVDVDAIRADLDLPLLHGEGRLGPVGPSGVGLSGSPATPRAFPHNPAPAFAPLRPFLPPPKWGGSTQAFRPGRGGGDMIIPSAGVVPDNPTPDAAEAPSRPSP